MIKKVNNKEVLKAFEVVKKYCDQNCHYCEKCVFYDGKSLCLLGNARAVPHQMSFPVCCSNCGKVLTDK